MGFLNGTQSVKRLHVSLTPCFLASHLDLHYLFWHVCSNTLDIHCMCKAVVQQNEKQGADSRDRVCVCVGGGGRGQLTPPPPRTHTHLWLKISFSWEILNTFGIKSKSLRNHPGSGPELPDLKEPLYNAYCRNAEIPTFLHYDGVMIV